MVAEVVMATEDGVLAEEDWVVSEADAPGTVGVPTRAEEVVVEGTTAINDQ